MEITKLTCICPKCWRTTPIELAMSKRAMHTKISYNHYIIHFDECVARGVLKFDPICNRCGLQEEYEDKPFIVDSMLGSAIKRFNKYGLKTNYSCQGHVTTDEYGNESIIIPYLMFKAGMDTIHILHDIFTRVNEMGYYPGLISEEIGMMVCEKGSYKRNYYTYEQACKLSKAKREQLEFCFILSDEVVDKLYNCIYADKDSFYYTQRQFVGFLELVCEYLPEKTSELEKRKVGKTK